MIQSTSTISQAGPILCDWLESFWDFNTSFYILERLSHGHSITKAHAANMAGKIRNYWRPFFGEFHRGELTRGKAREFAVHIAEITRTVKKNGLSSQVPLSGSTIKDVMQAGTVAYTWALSEGQITENPFDGLMGFSRPGHDSPRLLTV